MAIEIKILGKEDAESWDSVVYESLHGSIFHTWKWLKITETHTGYKLYPIVGYKGDEIIGIYPIFYRKRFGVKMIFSPPPYTAMSYLGPVILNYEKVKEDKRLYNFSEFHKKVDEFLFSELGANYASIYPPPKLIDCRPFKWTGYRIEPVFHYTLDLTGGSEYIWRQFKKGLRENVKTAKKRGIYFEEGGKEDLLLVYESLVNRYREQNRAVRVSKKYLLDLYDSFYPNNLRIFVAKYNGEHLSGIIALCFKETISFWIGAAKTDVKGLYPNDLLHWEGIKWACERGFKYYEEFGAGTERLARFKSKYNPTLVVCFSARKYSSCFIKWLELLYGKIRIKI